MVFRFLLASSLLAGCASHAPTPLPAAKTAPGALPADEVTQSQRPPSVPVQVTGVLQRDGQDVEICPGESAGPCAGIQVVGEVPAAWLSTPSQASVWRLSGDYDGQRLQLTAPAEPTDLGAPRNYRNPCPEFQQPAAPGNREGNNPDQRLTSHVDTLRREHAERIAGNWWDHERQAMVIWVKGDGAELRRAVRERYGKSRICIKGQARYSETELEQARSRADRILREGGSAWSSSSLEVLQNQVVYQADTLDAPTRAKLQQELGDAVRVVAFIQLRDHQLSQLPARPPRGDIQLVTAKTRSDAGMMALGRYRVKYDSARACVYLESDDGKRLLPVWPFGYWATAKPFQVFDQDDTPVAADGAIISFSGGQVDVAHVAASNTCGADTAWVGKPSSPR